MADAAQIKPFAVVGGFKPTPKVSTSLESAQAKVAQQQAETERNSSSVAESKQALRKQFFTQTQLNTAISQYAKTPAIQDSPLILTVLECPFMMQGGTQINIQLANPLQETQMPKLLPPLLRYLRDTLENDSIELIYAVAENATPSEAGEKLYTDHEKLRYLEENFPVFGILKEKLGLALG